MVNKLWIVLLAVGVGCDDPRRAKMNPPTGSAAPSATNVSHAARQAFIDRANERHAAGMRFSFGAEDVELAVEFADRPCTKEVLTAFGDDPAGLQAREAGFAHFSCTAPPPEPIQPPAPVEPPPIKVTARQLFADYEGNEVSADAKYRGKTVEVTGIVTKIAKDILGKPYVELQTSNQFMGVHAFFDDESAVIELKRGQKIVARCKGKGAMMVPLLEDCGIEHVFERVPG